MKIWKPVPFADGFCVSWHKMRSSCDDDKKFFDRNNTLRMHEMAYFGKTPLVRFLLPVVRYILKKTHKGIIIISGKT